MVKFLAFLFTYIYTDSPCTVKYHLRRYGDPCDLLGGLPEVRLMEVCVAAVTAEKARGWYRHSGYRF